MFYAILRQANKRVRTTHEHEWGSRILLISVFHRYIYALPSLGEAPRCLTYMYEAFIQPSAVPYDCKDPETLQASSHSATARFEVVSLFVNDDRKADTS